MDTAADMAWLPGGTFRMGSERFYPEEAPVREVEVDGFWIDRHPVTVREFQAFVRETGHRDGGRARADAGGIPGRGPRLLVAGSLVFQPPPGPVPLDDHHRWWGYVPGADWRHPTAPRRPSARAPPPGDPRGLGGRGRVRRLGRQGTAHRGRMGVRRARRHGRRAVRLGRRGEARRAADGQPLAGHVPAPQQRRRRLGGHLSGGDVPRKRLRPLRRDRQRLGVDRRDLFSGGAGGERSCCAPPASRASSPGA